MNHVDKTFALADDALAAIAACQRASGRREICGLCAEDPSGAQHFLALNNHEYDPSRFETVAADEAVLRGIAHRLEWRILAFVHTHLCGSPELSKHDMQSFRNDLLPWVIVAIEGDCIQQRTFAQ
ncbi:Mov34/MPN/PAD-1 family protein [Microvirga sp. G4-2]|uniref:Mov34/MPN/PAD-1 family protein n=1 Tax=Microvirga sp. G4-2 TaxID=3434467 RepID=UPI00404408A9